MKVFIPMSDEMMSRVGIDGELVPFDSERMHFNYSIGEDKKPSNWIPPSDREDARRRLGELRLN